MPKKAQEILLPGTDWKIMIDHMENHVPYRYREVSEQVDGKKTGKTIMKWKSEDKYFSNIKAAIGYMVEVDVQGSIPCTTLSEYLNVVEDHTEKLVGILKGIE
jgi:hypothetical protein